MHRILMYIPVLRHSIKLKTRFLMEEGGVRVTEIPVQAAQDILVVLEEEEKRLARENQALDE